MALRESDMHSWCVWPETEGLRKFYALMVATLVANGGEDRGGRKLLSWVLEAGVDREDVEAGFGAWCFSTPGEKRVWGEFMSFCAFLISTVLGGHKWWGLIRGRRVDDFEVADRTDEGQGARDGHYDG